jgi:hypothetical protein
MPTNTTLTVTVGDLRKGDYLQRWDMTVDHTNIRRLRASIFGYKSDDVVNQIKKDVDVDADLVIRREVPTAEEKEARKNEFLTASLEQSRNSAKQHLLDQQQKAVDKFNSEGGYGLDHWDIGELVSAQEVERCWATVDTIMEREGSDIITTFRAVCESLRERMLTITLASRSTSVISNAVEDIKHDAQVEFIRSAGFRL